MRTTFAKIDLDKFYWNYLEIKKIIQNRKFIAVVKANAYGHGLVEISRYLVEFGVDYLAVAFSSEAIVLRTNGIGIPILVLVPENDSFIEDCIDYNLDYTVDSFYLAKRISDYARMKRKIARLHLYVDTGMGRDGVHFSQALSLLEKITLLPNVRVVGLMSHFATAESNIEFAKLQLQRFQTIVKDSKEAGYEFDLIHIANSGAILSLPESFFNAVRPGILLYGYVPNRTMQANYQFYPILTLYSTVISERLIRAGDSVGYGQQFIATNKTRVVTVPIGYGDGFWRRFDSAFCIIRGKRYPIIGGVCMDEIMVEVGMDSDVIVGDEVVLLGSQKGEEISGYELAQIANTIIYEIPTSISTRVPRIYYKNGIK